MQHAAVMQVAHAAGDVVSNLKHCLDACERGTEATLRGDTPGQDRMLQQQRGPANQTLERSARQLPGALASRKPNAASGEDVLRQACMLQSRRGSQKDSEEQHRAACRSAGPCTPVGPLLTHETACSSRGRKPGDAMKQLIVDSVSCRIFTHVSQDCSNAAAGYPTSEPPCAPLLNPQSNPQGNV